MFEISGAGDNLRRTPRRRDSMQPFFSASRPLSVPVLSYGNSQEAGPGPHSPAAPGQTSVSSRQQTAAQDRAVNAEFQFERTFGGQGGECLVQTAFVEESTVRVGGGLDSFMDYVSTNETVNWGDVGQIMEYLAILSSDRDQFIRNEIGRILSPAGAIGNPSKLRNRGRRKTRF